MNNLGMLYEHGEGGLSRDVATARKWYERAAAGNEASAMNNLGNFYCEGTGTEKDLAQARKW